MSPRKIKEAHPTASSHVPPPAIVSVPVTTTATDDGSNRDGKSSSNRIPVMNRSYRICDSILDAIGETPLVRLNRIGKTTAVEENGVTATTTSSNINNVEFVVKCEYMNAGGSVKDRIGKQMIYDAERQGIIHPGQTTLIEPTSGNTGIGIALVSAIRGYQCIITMPEKMSKEKVDVLKALGAEIIRTPTEAAYDAPDSHISVAQRLQSEIPMSHILNQYINPSNPAAHYYGTAEEILRQCGCYDPTTGMLDDTSVVTPKIDMIVIGAGTGGTITGIAKRLKEYNPKLIVVGVDPIGSILAVPDSLNDSHRLESYNVEGIGYDFVPTVLDRSIVDYWYKSNDTDSFIMMRRLIRDEGILCGGSSGSAVCAAMHYAPKLLLSANPPRQHRCIIVLPDSVRNYMTKALSNDWMMDHGYVDNDIIQPKNYSSTWWSSKRVYEMGTIQTPLTITSDVLCKDAITLLKREGYDMVPVISNEEGGTVIGVVTEGNITKCILSNRCQPETTIADSGVIYKTFHKFTMSSTLHDIAQALDHDPFVLIVTEQRCFTATNRKRKNSTTTVSEDGTQDDHNLDGEDPASSIKAQPNSSGSLPNTNLSHCNITTRSVVSGIVSRIDLLDYISHGNPNESH